MGVLFIELKMQGVDKSLKPAVIKIPAEKGRAKGWKWLTKGIVNTLELRDVLLEKKRGHIGTHRDRL